MATKKKVQEPTPEKVAADLDLFEQQQHTGIVIAQTVAQQVFPGHVTPKLVLRIQGLLEWEDNGDPAEDQTEITERLKHAYTRGREWFNDDITPDDVLDLHEVIHEDYFDDDDEE